MRRARSGGDPSFPLQESVAYQLRDTYRAFVRAYQNQTTRYDIPVGMWFFLRVLWREDGLTQKELVERAGLMQPSTSAALKQMERRGLIRQLNDAEDRRKVKIFLTPKALELRRKMIPIAVRIRDQAVIDFSKREVAMLQGMLGRLKSNLEAWGDRESKRRRNRRDNAAEEG